MAASLVPGFVGRIRTLSCQSLQDRSKPQGLLHSQQERQALGMQVRKPPPQIHNLKIFYFPRNNDIRQDNEGKLGLPEIVKKEPEEIEAEKPGNLVPGPVSFKIHNR